MRLLHVSNGAACKLSHQWLLHPMQAVAASNATAGSLHA
jgi:hypothetical protein